MNSTPSAPSLADWLRATPKAALTAIDAEIATRSLEEYIKQAWHVVEPSTPLLWGWHHSAICDYLEAVTRGEITRLIINMPPRYGKSLFVSVMWPVWEWLRNPGERWLFASYSASLSVKHSVDRRTIIQSDWYQDRWSGLYQLTSDQNIKAEYQNDRRGVMVATSIGGTSIGKGGNRIVVDDPVNPQQAESDVEREAANRFFDTSLYTRLNDKNRGAIVVVMQRLRERDLTGHLMEQGGWRLLKLEGRAEARRTIVTPSGRKFTREAGDPLWPEREDAEQLAATERAMTPYVFAGQYQQRPAPAGGGLFRAEWFPVVEAVPSRFRKRVRYWDKAGTEGGGAYTAGVLMGQGDDDLFYVLDVVRGQWSAARREDTIRATAEADGSTVEIWLEQEPGSAGKESAQSTILNLRGFNVHAEPATGDKVTRARPFAAQAGAGGDGKAGNVRLRRGEWNRDFVGEAVVFPNGRYKDQIDAASGAFNKVALGPRPGRIIAGGKVPKLEGSLAWSPGMW